MSIVQSIIYGLTSGLSAFLPISLFGHQSLLNLLFGVSDAQAFRNLLIRISIIIAVIISNGTYLEKLRREMRRPQRSRRKVRLELSAYSYDYRLVRTGVFPMAIAIVILKLFKIKYDSFALLAFFFFVNGLALYLTDHVPHGNKDSKKLSAMDSLLIGVSSALCVLPGISRVGSAMSCCLVRGADRNKALDWILVLTIPLMLLLILFDIIELFAVGFGVFSFVAFWGCILSGIFSFLAAVGGIYFMRFLSIRTSYSVFAFYCWGTALLSFILYLNA